MLEGHLQWQDGDYHHGKHISDIYLHLETLEMITPKTLSLQVMITKLEYGNNNIIFKSKTTLTCTMQNSVNISIIGANSSF